MTSEPITQKSINLTASTEASLVRIQAALETEEEFQAQLVSYFGNTFELFLKEDQLSQLSSNQLESLTGVCARFLGDSEWQAIKANLKLSQRRSLEQDTDDRDYLLFPTLTAGASNGNYRPPGQVKLERWLKNKGLVQDGCQLSAQAMALIMGFPLGWLKPISPCHLDNQEG